MQDETKVALETSGPVGDMPHVVCDRPGPGNCTDPVNLDEADADVADMMAWEAGDMDPRREVPFFQRLVDTGLVWQLSGMYGRTAQRLINAGLVKFPEDKGQAVLWFVVVMAILALGFGALLVKWSHAV